MSTVTDVRPDGVQPLRRSKFYWALADGLVLAKRNLVQIPRIPELLVFATIQPVMFVLLFRYVFGGAIDVGGESYVNFLMAGIFVQTVEKFVSEEEKDRAGYEKHSYQKRKNK